MDQNEPRSANTQEPMRVGGDVKPPVKIYAPQPQYTEEARRAGVEGLVILQATIDEQGDVTKVVILKELSSGLDQAAADAVRNWKFKPARLAGKPVAVLYNLTVTFRLGDGDREAEERQLREAIERLEEANELAGGNSVTALLGLGRAYYRLGDHGKTVDLARRVLDLTDAEEYLAGAYNLLGLGLLGGAEDENGDLAEAEQAFRRVIALTGDENLGPRYGLALVLRDMGRDPDALSAARAILETQPAGPVSNRARKLVCHLKAQLPGFEDGDPEVAEQPASGPIEVGGQVVPPVKLFAPQPFYTERARQARIEGEVIIGAIIDQEGCVTDIEIRRGLPLGLGEAAAEAVKDWSFLPAKLDDQPVRVIYNLTVNFRLGKP